MNNILKTLADIGLNAHQINVYVALLKKSPCPASLVATESSLPRQTTYSILQILVNQRLVSQTDRNGVKQFIANPLDLLSIIEEKRSALEKSKVIIEKELPQLLALNIKGNQNPKISYYQGEGGLKKLLKNILGYYAAGGEKEFRGYGINRFEQTLNNYLYEFVKERWAHGVEAKVMISEKSDNDFKIIDAESSYGRKIKKLDIPEQRSAVYIVGTSVYLFSYEDGTGIKIDNESIASLLRYIFDDHWNKTVA